MLALVSSPAALRLGTLLACLAGPAQAQEAVVPVLEARVRSPFPAAQFGRGCDLSGSRAVIIAPCDAAMLAPCQVQVWERGPAGWALAQRILAPGPAPFFGHTISLDGDTFAVRGPDVVYVYRHTGSDWSLVAQLEEPAGSTAIASYGVGLALDGDTLAVTALQFVDFETYVYVYREVAGAWNLEQEVVVGGPSHRQVALDGDTFITTSYPTTQIFVREQGVWSRQASVGLEEPSQGGNMGWALALDGDFAIVGAPSASLSLGEPAHGLALVLERSGTSWETTARLTPPSVPGGGCQYRFFGAGVSVEGTRCLVAAPGHPCVPSAYVFERDSAGWRRQAEVLDPDAAWSHGYGFSAAVLDQGRAILGSPWAPSGLGPSNYGAASIFRLTDGIGLTFCAGDGCPCDNDADAGCANSTGAGAALEGAGSNGVATDDLVLESSGLPPGSLAILVAATEGTRVPFGDGLRCFAGSVFRFQPQQADASGAFVEGPGVAVTLGVSAGETRNFQAWYRDAGGPCGAGANTSNAYEIVFGP